MKFTVSKRASDISKSDIRSMSIACARVRGINLSQGICDLETPPDVIESAYKAMKKGINHYTRYDGTPRIRKALAKKLFEFNHIPADPEKNIIVSAGATGALFATCFALLNPGDEVIIFEPFYGYHVQTVLLVGAIPKYVKMKPPLWSFASKDIENAISRKTKAIIISNPSNPSGKVYTKDELLTIGRFCKKHGLFLISDEIYEYFTYDSHQFISPGSLKELEQNTITISGYSKTFSITGWRIGYLVCPAYIKESIGAMNDLLYVCAPAPLQEGVAGALRKRSREHFEAIKKSYLFKRDLICQRLQEVGLTPHVPQGAYYVLADVSRIPGKDSYKKAMFILRKTGVAVVPGRAFYHGRSGDNLVRVCFAKEDSEIDKACNQLLKLKSLV